MHLGSFIAAKVKMGRVRVITKDQINEVRDSNAWWKDYDTIYYKQDSEIRDEFCVKSPDQVLKMIMLMDDERVYEYGLDQEFGNTRCHCI